MKFRLSSRPIVGSLLIVWVILVVASILAILLHSFKSDHYLINEALENYIRLFSIDKEANIPTWNSSLLLFIASIALTIITSGHLYYGWVIPGALLFLIVALAYRKFVWTLPNSARLFFTLTGCEYGI